MGEFNLEGRSNPMEGATVIGGDVNRIGFIYNRFVSLLSHPKVLVANWEIAQYICRNAYSPNGEINPSFKSKRKFRKEDYDVWRSWENREGIININDFNFPIEMTDEFLTVKGIAARLNGIGETRVKKELIPILEERVFLPKPLRFACYPRSIVYHQEDALEIADDVFELSQHKSIENNTAYNQTELMKMISERTGKNITHITLKRLLNIVQEEGTRIKIDARGNSHKIFVNKCIIDALVKAQTTLQPSSNHFNKTGFGSKL